MSIYKHNYIHDSMPAGTVKMLSCHKNINTWTNIDCWFNIIIVCNPMVVSCGVWNKALHDVLIINHYFNGDYICTSTVSIGRWDKKLHKIFESESSWLEVAKRFFNEEKDQQSAWFILPIFQCMHASWYNGCYDDYTLSIKEYWETWYRGTQRWEDWH